MQALVIFKLVYCNAIVTGQPACVVKLLQMNQNAAVYLVFFPPRRTHVTRLHVALHWLLVDVRFQF